MATPQSDAPPREARDESRRGAAGDFVDDDVAADSSSQLIAEIRLLRERIREFESTDRGADDGPNSSHIDMDKFSRFAVENFSDAAFLVRNDARIVYVNAAASRLLGYSAQELTQMCIHELNPEITTDSWPEVWAALKQAGRRTFETCHKTKDGRIVPIEVTANLMSFEGQEYSCAFTRDITARKAMEGRLRQAEKMEAVGRLAGGIAHDFNNQLMGIQGYADFLTAEVANNPVAAKLVHNIQRGVGRAADLTAKLLAFSRGGKSISKRSTCIALSPKWLIC